MSRTPALPRGSRSRTPSDVTALPPLRIRFDRSRPVALLLAIVALLGMVVLANWHDSLPHVHDAAGATVTIELGDHHPGDRPEPGDPMHSAAHVVLQGIAIPAEPAVLAAAVMLPFVWAVSRTTAIRSIPPASILRPPRA